MTVEVLNPHGFCAGVTAAIRKAVELADGSSSVYCLHELVHNEIVVSGLRSRGFVFVEDICDVPAGATVLFSAHGVAPAVRRKAEARGLRVVDATCPFVTKVHKAAREFASAGLPVLVVGHPGHAEVSGIVGEVEDVGGTVRVISAADDLFAIPGIPLGARVGVVSQTTMNADEVSAMVERLRAIYEIETMAEVCSATKVRQDAVKAFDGDALLVLGSVSSSNTRRLCEVARCRTFRAGTSAEVKARDFSGVGRLGVTSGASTPEDFFRAVVRELEGK